MTLEQYQLVRVKCLLRRPTEYDGWRVNQRAPEIGDVGTVLEIIRADGLPDRFVVEVSRSDGETLWLADFEASELEPRGTEA